jgi:hypothetical protein
MDDIWQLRAGLAGPLIVLEPGTTLDPATDHVFTITTTHSLDDALKIFVNGSFAPPAITCRVGVPQRFRFLNMTTFWTQSMISLIAANRTLQWLPLQVDGADVTPRERMPQGAVTAVTIGQTRDFTFTPTAAGDAELQFVPDPAFRRNIVTVAVHIVG